MNISDIKYNKSININTSTQRQLTSDKSGESANAQISRLSKGEVFKGQILDIKDNQVVISMNGKNLFAHMAEAMNLNIGDELSFIISENNISSVTIKPIFNSAENMRDNAIFKMLEVNNFSPTDKNYQIAESLMKNNLPVDRTGIKKILQDTIKFPEAKIDTLTGLYKLGIEASESTISQYDVFVANNLKVMNSVLDLANDFGELSSYSIGQAGDNIAEILNTTDNLLGIISDDSDLSVLVTENADDNVFAQELMTNNYNIMPNGDIVLNSKEMYDLADFSSKIEDFSNSLKLSKDFINYTFEELSNAGLSNEMIDKIIENSKSPAQMLNNINAVINSQLDLLNQDILINFFNSEMYKGVLTHSLKQKMSLDADDMNDSKELNELYKNIYDKTNKLLNAFSGDKGQLAGNMSESANNLREQMDFVQNLNNMYAYAQIPVNISGNDANSELFVYMNKKHNMEQKESVSALLHLDMEHLGATDVHVSLSNNIVHTKFYVEDEESARIIDENMRILEKAINDFGYSLTNEVVNRDVSISSSNNKVLDEIVGSNLEQSVKRYSFDVRM